MPQVVQYVGPRPFLVESLRCRRVAFLQLRQLLLRSRLVVPGGGFGNQLLLLVDLPGQIGHLLLGDLLPAAGRGQLLGVLPGALRPGDQFVGGLGKLRLVDVTEDAVDPSVQGDRAAKDAGQGVVVLLRNGIKLVVVTAGALECHSQQGLSHPVDLAVHHVHPQLLLVAAHQFPRTERQKTGGDDAFRRRVRTLRHPRRGRDLDVAGKLLPDELVEGLVRVERRDDIVAIAPGVRRRNGAANPDGVRVGRQVQPMPRPAIPEALVAQQTIDDLGNPVGRRVRLKGVHIRGRRRQPDQIEMKPTQQHGRLRLPGRRQTRLVQPRLHKPVDRTAGPIGVGNLGRLDLLQRLERPQVLSRNGGRLLRLNGNGFRPGIGRAHGDPLAQDVDLRLGQPAFGRHFDVAVGIAHGLHQETRLRSARNDRRARVPAPLPTRLRVERQAAFHLLRDRVARVAMLDQQRPHLLLEETKVFGGRNGRREGEDEKGQRVSHDNRMSFLASAM
jgi:hypothetical protein